VQRIEYVRTVYRQLQFSSVRQFSRTALLLSGSANDIENSRSTELSRVSAHAVQNMACPHGWQRYTRSWEPLFVYSNVLFWTVRYIPSRRLTPCQTHRLWWCTELPLKVLHFPALQSRPPNSSPAFSGPAFSASPLKEIRGKSWFWQNFSDNGSQFCDVTP